jgi:hypothetical protein
MKRRDFLVTSAGLAGAAALPSVGFGQTKPCPPPSLSAGGGTSVTTSCTNTSGTADWITRSTAPGVVWSHNFEAATEAGAFRVVANVGNDPSNSSNSTCIWDAADGFAGGGSLSISLPTGALSKGYWNRPMSALKAGSNGKTVDDLAANGTLTKRTYNANSTSADWDFRTGYYGHSTIQAANPTWNGQSNVWDGNEFYIQFRAKISGSRWTTGNPSGKLMFIDVTGLTGTQEIVIQSENVIGAAGDHYYKTNPFRMYSSQGSEPNSLLTSPQGSSGLVQPGGAFPNCTVSNLAVANACWEWPKDEWVTVLVHVIPGRDNDAFYGANPDKPLSAWPYHDMTIEAWVARTGATAYTKVYEQFNLAWDYYTSGARHPAAFNKIGPTAYMNSGATPQPAVAGWSHKFTQLIFSKQFIPCPA